MVVTSTLAKESLWKLWRRNYTKPWFVCVTIGPFVWQWMPTHGNSGHWCLQFFHVGYIRLSPVLRPSYSGCGTAIFPDTRLKSVNIPVMLNRPTLEPWDQLREWVHRWPCLPYLFICLFMPRTLLSWRKYGGCMPCSEM